MEVANGSRRLFHLPPLWISVLATSTTAAEIHGSVTSLGLLTPDCALFSWMVTGQ